MSMVDYRKTVNTDEEIVTPTAMPRYTVKQSLALRVAIAGHSRTIGELDGMTFYRVCQQFMAGRPKKWGMLRMVFCDQEIDEMVKWNVVLELLHVGVVKVERGVLVVKEKGKRAA